MSSRTEAKAEAREARLAAERAAEKNARRRRAIFLGTLLAAAAVVAVVAVVAGSGSGDEPSAPEPIALFDGIPQSGEWLGDPSAPVVVEEYADLQCPFCAQFATTNLPPIVEDYVRPGDVRMRLRILTFIGEDSVEAGRAAPSPGLQDRMWDFTESFYERQGPENSGYVDEDFLRDVGARVSGLDIDRVLADMPDPKVAETLRTAQADATAAGVESTPSFRVGRRGGEMKVVAGDELPGAIAEALARR